MAQPKTINKAGNKRGIRHGMSHVPEYYIWENMKSRCTNSKLAKYKIYGGRGIKVCERWNSFQNFYADMGKRPTMKHQIDRIDVNGNYSPENCRWVTNRQNCRNKRNNLLVRGKTLSEWGEILNIKRSTLAQRYYVYGWSVDRVLTKI